MSPQFFFVLESLPLREPCSLCNVEQNTFPSPLVGEGIWMVVSYAAMRTMKLCCSETQDPDHNSNVSQSSTPHPLTFGDDLDDNSEHAAADDDHSP